MEPFKNIFSPEMVDSIALHLGRATDIFDAELFKKTALKNLTSLELKQRSEQFSYAIEAALPCAFMDAVKAMLRALHPETTAGISDMGLSDRGLSGWSIMPLTAYIARNGLDEPAFSLKALREMTMRSTSEFDVRPFIRDYPDLTLAEVAKWAVDDNEHVRRLASEGSRPRLPWGMRLHTLVADPSPLIPILTSLRDDESEYVRRSVANNLNDIAKDHPELVADIAKEWLRDAPEPRVKLVRHACRTLIKQGHAGVLASFGFGPFEAANASLHLNAESAKMGDDLTLTLRLESGATSPQNLMIDYIMHYRRANGGTGAKVFKWTQKQIAVGQGATFTKVHKLREVTTRKHYPGAHRVEVQVNGKIIAEATFDLHI